MGIKDLTKYFNDNCSEKAINKNHLVKYRGKTIVVDTSIYMYKFKTYDRLVTNMRKMITILLKYNITPLFIFDGKPTAEKNATRLERYRVRRNAESKYYQIQVELDNLRALGESPYTDEIERLQKQQEIVRKQFVRVTHEDNSSVKDLLTSYNIKYIIAHGEADRLCVELVHMGKAWACLSDDMDMFVYGCPRVMRHISLRDDTVIFYDTNKILHEIGVDLPLFRKMIILTGTDYNKSVNVDLLESSNWIMEYKKSTNEEDFYDWINTKIKDGIVIDLTILKKTYNLFCLGEENRYISDANNDP